ncbi:hypothetical protein F5888DRAFT_1635428 [Russula emetica]|nr:hypothetical protein F5888DRAFT_1635428 [Russula emetica]
MHSMATLSSSDCDSSPKESIVPYANQNFGSAHPTGIAVTVDGPIQTWSVAPQAPNQENVNAGYAPLPEAVVPIQNGAVPNEVQAIDIWISSVEVVSKLDNHGMISPTIRAICTDRASLARSGAARPAGCVIQAPWRVYERSENIQIHYVHRENFGHRVGGDDCLHRAAVRSSQWELCKRRIIITVAECLQVEAEDAMSVVLDPLGQSQESSHDFKGHSLHEAERHNLEYNLSVVPISLSEVILENTRTWVTGNRISVATCITPKRHATRGHIVID